ncbi:MAG: YidC/Oxa1 family membrane protein insertase, partial [Patescibacteria group bacterium]
MTVIFNEFIYQPIYNLLIFVYNFFSFQDFGVAIVLVTVLVKLALFPLSRKQIESQKKLQELQPKIKELQSKYKNDKEKQSRALMELYKENKANPLS